MTNLLNTCLKTRPSSVLMASIVVSFFSGIPFVAFGATAYGVQRASGADSYVTFVLVIALIAAVVMILRLVRRLRDRDVETLEIRSDRETMFTQTTVIGNASTRKPAAVVDPPHHPDWNTADTVYKELANCQWLAESPIFTQEEALSGGKYTFEREFVMPATTDNLVSAELLVLVDNWCSPFLNGTELGRQGGKIEIFPWDLTESLQQGKNLITFEVENNASPDYLSDDPNWAQWNPYGLKYLIRIRYKR